MAALTPPWIPRQKEGAVTEFESVWPTKMRYAAYERSVGRTSAWITAIKELKAAKVPTGPSLIPVYMPEGLAVSANIWGQKNSHDWNNWPYLSTSVSDFSKGILQKLYTPDFLKIFAWNVQDRRLSAFTINCRSWWVMLYFRPIMSTTIPHAVWVNGRHSGVWTFQKFDHWSYFFINCHLEIKAAQKLAEPLL